MSYFEDQTIEEADAFERKDLTAHRVYLADLKTKWQTTQDGKVAIGTVTVPTGEPDPKHPGRGKDELDDERGFRKVAREYDMGLRISHRNLGNGKTQLRMAPKEKKEFSAEAIQKRTKALSDRRERLAIERYAKEHGKSPAQLTQAEARGALEAYRASKATPNGVATAKKVAPKTA